MSANPVFDCQNAIGTKLARILYYSLCKTADHEKVPGDYQVYDG